MPDCCSGGVEPEESGMSVDKGVNKGINDGESGGRPKGGEGSPPLLGRGKSVISGDDIEMPLLASCIPIIMFCVS